MRGWPALKIPTISISIVCDPALLTWSISSSSSMHRRRGGHRSSASSTERLGSSQGPLSRKLLADAGESDRLSQGFDGPGALAHFHEDFALLRPCLRMRGIQPNRVVRVLQRQVESRWRRHHVGQRPGQVESQVSGGLLQGRVVHDDRAIVVVLFDELVALRAERLSWRTLSVRGGLRLFALVLLSPEGHDVGCAVGTQVCSEQILLVKIGEQHGRGKCFGP